MNLQKIGRYEIVRVLGRGAMGVVYLSRDPIIDRNLAVKTLRVDLDNEFAEEFRERFMREARAAGRLNHNGIVTIHDVGEDPASGTVFIAMEYIRGRDLKDVIDEGYHFRPSEAARIVADVATALDYAHSMGVVHRDIKPANIILTSDGTPKVMDFGVARLESSNLTVEGQFIGTPNFMSPEQITGKPVDGRSDIFSLGVLLFNLLTSKRPFSGSNIHEVTLKIVSEACPIPSTVVPGLPPAFNPIILKCLEKDPDKRFQNGGEVAQVLAALARSLTQRESTDTGSTAVVSPDLMTRIARPAEEAEEAEESAAVLEAVADPAATAPVTAATRVAHHLPTSKTDDQGSRAFSPNTAAIKRPKITKPTVPFSELIKKLPLPQVLLADVRLKWVLTVILSWSVLLTTVIAVLITLVDHGPFPAPSDASIRNLSRTAATFRAASRLLADGQLEAADRTCRAALNQAPTSPAGRRLMADIRARMIDELSSETKDTRIDELLGRGRELYRSGRYEEAAERFRDILNLDSSNQAAASFLDLIDERTRQTPPTTSPIQVQPTAVPRTTASTSRPAPTKAPAQTQLSGRARITLFFDSPLSEGSVLVKVNGEMLAEIPFNFTKKILGIRKKGKGKVKKIMMLPAGRHRVDVELIDAETGSKGSKAFRGTFRGDSNWTLRIDLPSATAEPEFFLVQPSR